MFTFMRLYNMGVGDLSVIICEIIGLKFSLHFANPVLVFCQILPG
jgi:hypothetical protein